jgi:hypothetical protein
MRKSELREELGEALKLLDTCLKIFRALPTAELSRSQLRVLDPAKTSRVGDPKILLAAHGEKLVREFLGQ